MSLEDGGRKTWEEPGGADPGANSQARLTCLRADQPHDGGAQNSLPQGLHYFHSVNYVALLEIQPFGVASWLRLVGGKALLGGTAMGHWKQEGDEQQLQSSSLGLYTALPHLTFTATP